jgi:hypothetical protein
MRSSTTAKGTLQRREYLVDGGGGGGGGGNLMDGGGGRAKIMWRLATRVTFFGAASANWAAVLAVK